MCLAILVIRDTVLLWKVPYDSVNRLSRGLYEVDGVGHGVAFALLAKIFHLVYAILVQLVEVDLQLGEKLSSEAIKYQDGIAW